MSDELIAKLDELKSAIVAASIPFDKRWLDTDGAAALLGVSVGHFRDRIACKPGFPKPARYTGGHPHWKASEVDEWADRQRINRAA